MAAVNLGELPLRGPLAIIGEGVGPGGELLRSDGFLLQAVDSSHEPSQQGASAAAKVVVGERQLVDPLEQHRQSIAGSEQRLKAVGAENQGGELDRRADA